MSATAVAVRECVTCGEFEGSGWERETCEFPPVGAESRAKRRDRIMAVEGEWQAVRGECVAAWGRLSALAERRPVAVMLGLLVMAALVFVPGTIERM